MPLNQGAPHQEPQPQPEHTLEIVSGAGFSGWTTLNDTIMGGRSSGRCSAGSEGLVMESQVVEEGGGFVSCRSADFVPPLDLSPYRGLALEVDGDGRRYKLAVACADRVTGAAELIPGGLRWVAEFDTEPSGTTRVVVPFQRLTASVRARPLGLPLRFDPRRIKRLQILHSRFNDSGGLNPGFRAGPLRLRIRRIEAVP
jgi:hypothetical protein